MIKNYCIKVISSVFIMLTIVLVSTSVFATELSEQYSNIYTLGGSITAQGIPLHDTPSTPVSVNGVTADLTTYKQIYLSNNGFYYCIYIKPDDTSSNPYIDKGLHFYIYDNDTMIFYQNNGKNWTGPLSSGNSFFISYADFKKAYIYSETTTDIYNTSGTLIYDWEDVYNDSFGKRIVYQVNYSEDNKTAILSAEIKNCAEGDKLYYSLLGFRFNGKLMNPIELNQSQATAITLSRNTMIHLQALDSER